MYSANQAGWLNRSYVVAVTLGTKLVIKFTRLGLIKPCFIRIAVPFMIHHTTLTFINPSLFSLWSLEAALWRRFLWEFKTESITCHHVRQFKIKAKPTTHATDISIAFTVMFFGSMLKMASNVIPAIMQLNMKRKITKDGRQQVFFHFFLPIKQKYLKLSICKIYVQLDTKCINLSSLWENQVKQKYMLICD